MLSRSALLGAMNTIIAALLAPHSRGKAYLESIQERDEMEFRRVRDFIEETEALIVAVHVRQRPRRRRPF